MHNVHTTVYDNAVLSDRQHNYYVTVQKQLLIKFGRFKSAPILKVATHSIIVELYDTQ